MSNNAKSAKMRREGFFFGLFLLAIFFISQIGLYWLISQFVHSRVSPEFMKASPVLWTLAILLAALVGTVILLFVIFKRIFSTPSPSVIDPDTAKALATRLTTLNRRAETQKLTAALLGLVAVAFDKYIQEPNLLHSFATFITLGGALILLISSTRMLMLIRSEARAADIAIQRNAFDVAVLVAEALVIVAIGYVTLT